MKKFRFLLAFVVVVAMVSSFAMATEPTDILNFEKATITSDGTSPITVNLVSKEGFSSCLLSFEVNYDGTVWTFSSDDTSFGNPVGPNTSSAKVAYYFENESPMNVAADGGIAVSFVLTPKAQANVDDSEITVSAVSAVDDSWNELLVEDNVLATTTVTVAAPPAVTPIDVTESEKSIAEQIEEVEVKNNGNDAKEITQSDVTHKLYNVYTADLSFVATNKIFGVQIFGTENEDKYKLFTDSRVESNGATVEFKLALMGVDADEAAGLKDKIKFIFGDAYTNAEIAEECIEVIDLGIAD